jgi:DNA-binding transcriptional regulator GbsR (MarR family)
MMSERNTYQKLLEVKRAIEDGPIHGLTLSDLVGQLGEDRSTVSRIVLELIKAEVVEESVVGRGLREAARYVPGRRGCLAAYLRQLRTRAEDAARQAAATRDLLAEVLGVSKQLGQIETERTDA